VAPNFFNISLSFRTDSDVIVPYDTFDELNTTMERGNKEERWSEEEVNVLMDLRI
jgi:hypothetical protein